MDIPIDCVPLIPSGHIIGVEPDSIPIADDPHHCPITKGNEMVGSPTLKPIDGTDVKSIPHMIELIHDAEGDSVEFSFLIAGRRR